MPVCQIARQFFVAVGNSFWEENVVLHKIAQLSDCIGIFGNIGNTIKTIFILRTDLL